MCIFLLDQKVEPLEFLDRLKAVAIEFNKLTDTQKLYLNIGSEALSMRLLQKMQLKY